MFCQVFELLPPEQPCVHSLLSSKATVLVETVFSSPTLSQCVLANILALISSTLNSIMNHAIPPTKPNSPTLPHEKLTSWHTIHALSNPVTRTLPPTAHTKLPRVSVLCAFDHGIPGFSGLNVAKLNS